MADKPQTGHSSALKKGWIYFYRSARLKCPVCGISPIFGRLREVKSVTNWFETLPGCPRCNYVYNREPGYFMLPLWSLDYGVSAIFGIALALILLNNFQLSTFQLLLFTLVPTLIVAILIVRHAKAFYLAIDHYFFHDDDHPPHSQPLP